MVRVAAMPQFKQCQQSKWPLLSYELWSCVRACRHRGWDCRLPGTEPGTLGHWGQSKLVWLVKTHNTAPKHAQSLVHTSKHTHKVQLKTVIKTSVELITFPAIYMSTHAEHLCPPPFAVLLWLIVFSSIMIMIILAVKHMQIHKHLPWQTSWQESVIFFQQKERNIFKRKYIKSETLPILFLSSSRLCHTLIHLFPGSIMHVDPSTPAAPLGTTVSYLLSLAETPAVSHPDMSKTSVERLCFWKLYPE